VENPTRKSELLDKIPEEMHSHIMAYGKYIGDEREILGFTAGYPINRDWRPVMEYYFWRNRQREVWEAKK
jgi:hypothetical protein